MNPDFTLIWPLSCLKDGDHLCYRSPAPEAISPAPLSGLIMSPALS